MAEWFADPTKVGVTILLLTAVVAYTREWVIPGVTHTKQMAEKDKQIADLKTERDEFKQMVITSLNITERTQRVRGGALLPTGDQR